MIDLFLVTFYLNQMMLVFHNWMSCKISLKKKKKDKNQVHLIGRAELIFKIRIDVSYKGACRYGGNHEHSLRENEILETLSR